MAEGQVRNDGIMMNVLTGMGTQRDRGEYATVNERCILTPQQEATLSTEFPISAMVEAYPAESIAKGWEVRLGQEEDSEKIIPAFNQYRMTIGGESEDEERITDSECFAEATYLANVYGGSAIIIVAEDGKPPSEPLDTKRIKTIASLEVLDRHKLFPDLSLSYSPHNYSHYWLQQTAAKNDRMYGLFNNEKTATGWDGRIHRSRVIRFPGRPTVPDIMMQNSGWERSLISEVYSSFKSWNRALFSVESLLDDYSLFIYYLKGLADLMVEGSERNRAANESALRTRLEALRMMTSTLGGVALDSEDEKVEFITRSFQGVPEIMSQFRDLLIGASRIPHTILFGESPSGLGATGESEEKTWAKMVGQFQQRVLHSRLRRLYRLIWLAKDGPTKGEEPKDWHIHFNPLLEESPEQKIGNLSTFIQSLSTALSAQFILPEEARASFAGAEPIFNLVLNKDEWEAKQQEAEQAFGGFEGGEAAPEEEVVEEPVEGAEETPADDFASELDGEAVTDSRLDANKFTDEGLHQQAYREAKAKFKVFPSAYASMWLSKRYRELYRKKHGNTKGLYRSDDTREWLEEKWVRISSSGEILGPCGDRSEKEGKPKCLPVDRARSMSKAERAATVRKKRRKDPDKNRSGAAVMVKTEPEK